MRVVAAGIVLAAAAIVAAWVFLRSDGPAIEVRERAAPATAKTDGLAEPAPIEPAIESRSDAVGALRLEDTLRVDAPAPKDVDLAGTIELWRDFAADAPEPPADGHFEFTIYGGPAIRSERVVVEDGRFRATVPAEAELMFLRFELAGRTAWINGAIARKVPPDGRIELVALQLHELSLRVVDGTTGVDLDDVTIVEPNSLIEHPGRPREDQYIAERKRSPLQLEPIIVRGDESTTVPHLIDVCVVAPGYAWTRAHLNFLRDGPSSPVGLARGGSLVVEARSSRPIEANGLRFRLAHHEPRQPYLDVEASLDSPMRFDGIRQGTFLACILRGPPNDPEVLGAADVVIRPGEETRVTIDVVADPPPRVPIGGTIEIPESWGGTNGVLRLSRLEPDSITRKRHSQEIHLNQMDVMQESPRVLRFKAESAEAGPWRAAIGALGLVEHFEVGPDGAPELRFRAGDAAGLRLTFLDSRTLQPIAPLEFRWSPKNEAGGEWSSVVIPATAKDCELIVPVGAVEVSVSPDARGPRSSPPFNPRTFRLDVRPGRNEERIVLEPPIGVRITFEPEDSPVEIAQAETPFELRPIFGEGDVTWWTRSWRVHQIFVTKPGRWRLTCMPIEAYEPIEPIELELEAAGLKDVTIRFRPRN